MELDTGDRTLILVYVHAMILTVMSTTGCAVIYFSEVGKGIVEPRRFDVS